MSQVLTNILPFPSCPGAQRLEFPTLLEDLKTGLAAANPPSPLGFTGACYTAAEWAVLHPGAPYGPPADPGDPPVLAAGQVPWSFLYKRYSDFITHESACKTALLAKLDATTLAVVKEPDGTLSATPLATIIQRLRDAYQVATPVDISTNNDKLTRPYSPSMRLAEHLLSHRTAHAYAAAQGFPILEPTKVDLLRKSLQPCHVYDETLKLFVVMFTTVVTQTFAALADMLVTAEANLASQTTVVAAGYAQAVTASQLSSLEELVRSLQAEVRAANSSKTAGGSASRANPAAFAPGNIHYCWTHGPKASHPSFACTKQAAGHQVKATARNTLGGKA